nr:ATP-binding protein [Kibdelosporangium sp. MJ126-NF4]CEL20890.1 Serine phosphatase RsbU, regulator of sigma subunit [Kibdelosporangium sp. MJ126-NF4]CTQ98305.1 Serine phosphatase RsbU, regulator of sigma subunit [Kibdelosporangium sp. MJ126-NF4]
MVNDTDVKLSGFVATDSTDAVGMWARSLPGAVREAVLDADLSRSFVFRQCAGVATSLSALRRTVTTWAHRLDLGVYQADDIVLAVEEAATNSIEHGYRDRSDQHPGTVSVLAWSCPTQRTVSLVVADEGTWRPPEAPGTRGRGLVLMRKVTDRFDLYTTGHGTVAFLRWAVR